MVTQIWVSIGSGNGLLPDGTKSDRLSDIHLIASLKLLQSITKITLKIIHLNFYLNLPGDNELKTYDAWFYSTF